MVSSSRYSSILDEVPVYMEHSREDVDLYLVGSARASKKRFFSAELSDLDLLFVCNTQSIDDYVDHFTHIINLQTKLSSHKDQLIEAFFASVSIVQLHFLCLSTIGGSEDLARQDLLYGSGRQGQTKSDIIPSDLSKKNLYLARATSFCNEYGRLLPIADTARARKTSKVLLRGLKLLICANTPEQKLNAMEKMLFSVATFHEINTIFRQATGEDLQVGEILEKALAGEDVGDWPEWMIAQDKIARQLLHFGERRQLSLSDMRLYETMTVVIHDMLIAGLKNIFSEKNAQIREKQIGEYADKTASLVVKLALSGVEKLINLESLGTPLIVKSSYQGFIKHLQGDLIPSLRVLAMAVILLEYSLTQSVAYVNQK